MASDNSQIYSSLSAAMQSFLSIRPMFDLNPLDNKTSSNLTLSLYSHIFGFEKLFESREDVDRLGIWMKSFWIYSFLFAFLYVVFIKVGVSYMSSRPRYELRGPLIIWNLFLAIFSILGAIRVWPEFFYALTNKGVVYSICDSSYAYSITGFWAFMFIMSKLPELVDTVFIVFRKQKLIFLHWYHHATVLIYCWYSYKDFSASGRWFMAMNYLVHAIMYSYYACKAMRIHVPVFISKMITASQIIQMVAGCYVNWVAYNTKKYTPEVKCDISDENITFSSLMYLSYLILFMKFFLNAYVFKSSKSNENSTISNKIRNGNRILKQD